jgi:hypothetical protein
VDEAAWLACTDPWKMLEFLHSRGMVRLRAGEGLSGMDRKLRLFACACCRSVWHQMPDEKSRAAVQVAERFADWRATIEELNAARAAAEGSAGAAAQAASRLAGWEVMPLQGAARWKGGARRRLGAIEAARIIATRVASDALGGQCDLLRDIFGKLFRPVRPLGDSVLGWNGATVRRTAEGIYEESAFDRLPILADALLDSGCEDEELIAHCRSAGPHVRGCWAVDAILGKS